MTLLKVFCVGW